MSSARRRRRAPRGPIITRMLTMLLAAGPASLAAAPAGTAAEDGESGGELSGGGAVLLSGAVVPGELASVVRDGERAIRLAGRDEPIPLYEVQEIRPGSAPEAKEIDFDAGPLVRFDGGAELVARVVLAGGDGGPTEVPSDATVLRIEGIGEVPAPVSALRAFRLRETHPRDDIFEKDILEPPPETDTVYVRSGSNLLRVGGTFRGLSGEHLFLERSGQVRLLRRQLVQGVILAKVASRTPEADPPAVFEIFERGRLPGYLEGIEAAAEGAGTILRVRLPGAPADQTSAIPASRVIRVVFASDRVDFLSSLEPSRVEEVPVLGRSLPYRKDRSAGGGPLTLGGRVYRRGLGVRSRSVLEYALGGRYKSFAAVIGIDDGAGPGGSATFSVAADGKEIFRKPMFSKDPPQAVSLPMDGVNILSLVVDYGPDGLDVGDHADWADARVSR